MEPSQVEQSFITSLRVSDHIAYASNDSVVILDTGATANLICFRWLDHHNSILRQWGLEKVTPYRANATFRFGDGRTGDVGFAADVTVGLAGAKGQFTAFVLDSDIPALLSRNPFVAV